MATLTASLSDKACAPNGSMAAAVNTVPRRNCLNRRISGPSVRMVLHTPCPAQSAGSLVYIPQGSEPVCSVREGQEPHWIIGKLAVRLYPPAPGCTPCAIETLI